jgi:enoyl-CoA hydratase/carnithine racemase
MHTWLDLLVRLSRAATVSVASIRGRTRGAGSEFVLACDMRFASRENTVIGQFEVGSGAVPGGGPMTRLSRLVGADARSRSCSSPTTSTDRGRSSTGTSTG